MTLLGRFQLAATIQDFKRIKKIKSNTDVIELCSRDRANTKWKFYKLMIVTIFAALLKDVSMDCRDIVLPDPLSKNLRVQFLTFEKITRKPYNDNLCLLRAQALQLHEKERL